MFLLLWITEVREKFHRSHMTYWYILYAWSSIEHCHISKLPYIFFSSDFWVHIFQMTQRNVPNCQAIMAATPTTLTFSGCAMSPISAMGRGGRRFARNLPLQLGGKEFLIYKLYLIGKNIVVMAGSYGTWALLRLRFLKWCFLGSRRLQLPTNYPPGIVCFPRTWTQGGGVWEMERTGDVWRSFL